MIHRVDSGFRVAAAVREHAKHADARDTLARLLSAGDVIAVAPQVLAEFIDVVTDARRFAQPLDMTAARQLAEQWWTAREVVRVFPDDAATRQFLAWLQQFSLGRAKAAAGHTPGRNLQRGWHPIPPHHQFEHPGRQAR